MSHKDIRRFLKEYDLVYNEIKGGPFRKRRFYTNCIKECKLLIKQHDLKGMPEYAASVKALSTSTLKGLMNQYVSFLRSNQNDPESVEND